MCYRDRKRRFESTSLRFLTMKCIILPTTHHHPPPNLNRHACYIYSLQLPISFKMLRCGMHSHSPFHYLALLCFYFALHPFPFLLNIVSKRQIPLRGPVLQAGLFLLSSFLSPCIYPIFLSSSSSSSYPSYPLLSFVNSIYTYLYLLERSCC